MNMAKTELTGINNGKIMAVTKTKGKLKVNNFGYLVSILTEDWRCEVKMKTRIAIL